MAKQTDGKKSRKWLSWVICLVLLLVTGGATYMIWRVRFGDKTTETGTAGESSETVGGIEEDEQGEEIEEQPEEKTDATEEPPQKVTQYEGEDPNKSEELTGTITYAGVVEENLMIRTNIDQFLSEGECSLTIQREGVMIYEATAGIVAGASTSSCQGFDVPTAALGTGTAQIVINLNAENKIGTLTTEVNI